MGPLSDHIHIYIYMYLSLSLSTSLSLSRVFWRWLRDMYNGVRFCWFRNLTPIVEKQMQKFEHDMETGLM